VRFRAPLPSITPEGEIVDFSVWVIQRLVPTTLEYTLTRLRWMRSYTSMPRFTSPGPCWFYPDFSLLCRPPPGTQGAEWFWLFSGNQGR
jgi:hypothetical protein